MQKFRTTFKRSRTPTGAEMKTQSSLEVPKQVRSASFDEMQLEKKRVGGDVGPESLLRVPTAGQRSKSMDSGAEEGMSLLEVPSRKYNRRRSSGSPAPVFCVHCQYIDDIAKFHQSISVEEQSVDTSLSLESLSSLLASSSDDSSSETEGPDEVIDDDFNFVNAPCSITVTLSPNSPSDTSQQPSPVSLQLVRPPEISTIPPPDQESDFEVPETGRRKSITSPKLERQSALVVIEANSSLESVPDAVSDSDGDIRSSLVVHEDVRIEELKMGGSDGDVQASCVNIFLQVPELKRDRAASVDSCFTKVSQSGKAEEVKVDSLEPPGSVSLRSRSVDIVLPTDEQARYKALSMSHRQPPPKG